MKKIVFLFGFALTLLSACNTGSVSQGGVDDMAPLFGVWERQATYVNGVLEHETPATLKIEANLYSASTALCTTSGTALAEGGKLTVTMDESDCPAPMQLPFTLVYDYEVTEDGQIMNLSVQGVREEYVKVE